MTDSRDPSSPSPATVSQLKWRCRRGMRELDVLLERYLQERYPLAPAAEQHAFQALLELPDPELFAYLTGREAPSDPQWIHVITKLTESRS